MNVSSEIGTLRRLIIHSPDSGLGRVVPSKAQDWLFEDIVHLQTMRKFEYDYYLKLLLYFLDQGKVKGKISDLDSDETRSFYKPNSVSYFKSDAVVEFQCLLGEISENELTRIKLIASVCAVERHPYNVQQKLLVLKPTELANVLISGTYPNEEEEMLFPPIPNLLFTRDLGIMINDHLLLNRPAKQARTRESLLCQYVVYNHPLFESLRKEQRIIELPENKLHFILPENEKSYNRTTIEGGDLMIVAPTHLLIGISERTTIYAAQCVIQTLFEKKIVEKVTLLKIPTKRDYMHIDTLFTQVKRNVWVLYHKLARRLNQQRDEQIDPHMSHLQTNDDEHIKILQFSRLSASQKPHEIVDLKDLLIQISVDDLGVASAEDVKFIYSGNNQFPYGTREQWTDSCNVLALKEGVVIGYDRNDKTEEGFRQAGFKSIRAADLLKKFESGELTPDDVSDTLITLPSGELSRARGGSHCMSFPLQRDDFKL
jgi:arginine deiminase